MSEPLSRLFKASITPNHTATAYADGDAFGTKKSVSVHEMAGRSIVIREIHVYDLEKVTANDIDIYVFNADFTGGTDNDAFSIVDADASKYMGLVEVAAANYDDVGGFEKAFKADVDMVVPLAGTLLYVQPVAGAAFDSTGTSQVVIEFIFERQS